MGVHETDTAGILLSSLKMSECRTLFGDGQRRTYSEGQVIFMEGDPGTEVILIESGRVELSITSMSGRKSVLAYMGSGEVLGEIAALDGGTRSATVTAMEPVAGLVLARKDILTFVSARPEVARSMIVELCAKARNASSMFSAQVMVEGGPRLARALILLFGKWGEERDGRFVLTQRFSQSEIGEFGGLARENVNRYLKKWIAQGILAQDGQTLVLVDRPRLEELAGL